MMVFPICIICGQQTVKSLYKNLDSLTRYHLETDHGIKWSEENEKQLFVYSKIDILRMAANSRTKTHAFRL